MFNIFPNNSEPKLQFCNVDYKKQVVEAMMEKPSLVRLDLKCMAVVASQPINIEFCQVNDYNGKLVEKSLR